MVQISPEALAEIARRLEGQGPKVGVRIYVRGFG
jgi:Fe-S cluster assembly iron-binding protein IscA